MAIASQASDTDNFGGMISLPRGFQRPILIWYNNSAKRICFFAGPWRRVSCRTRYCRAFPARINLSRRQCDLPRMDDDGMLVGAAISRQLSRIGEEQRPFRRVEARFGAVDVGRNAQAQIDRL